MRKKGMKKIYIRKKRSLRKSRKRRNKNSPKEIKRNR